MISKKYPWNPALFAGLSALGLLFFLISPLPAEPAGQAIFAQRATVAYDQAKQQFATATNGSPTAWMFARACYNLADFATQDDPRAALAQEGMDACHKLLAVRPNSGPGHYYLGMNEGQLARTELVGALFLVRDMEREFKLAWNLDENIDHGGPARSLGLLYRDAPGWPTSIGSRRKARDWLERADHVDPNFPENPMVLCETYLKWGNYKEAGQKFQELLKIWPQAQKNLTGVAWEHDWADWAARRAEVQNELAERESSSISTSGNK
jgi:tetratricopeptide (TPR) repeat protein